MDVSTPRVSSRLIFAAVLAATCIAAAPTTQPTTQRDSAQQAAIRAMLKDFNDQIATKGAQWAMTFCYCTNDQERQFAQAGCDAGADLALLYLAANDRFGKAGVNAVRSAYQDTLDDDIDSASIAVAGNRATVTYTRGQADNHLILVNGKWMDDTAAEWAQYKPEDRPGAMGLIKQSGDIATDMAKRVVNGDFATVEQFSAALAAKLQGLQ